MKLLVEELKLLAALAGIVVCLLALIGLASMALQDYLRGAY
ncbi:hypothetical protein RZA67_09915 [Stenotrophomonas sp. C3(2023)]|nr:hypothetical protein [Stenotrophomonas sp. C3(2023)]MDV3469045.1 hypothetical protein [Stenotrophomonas sp. C3(2023)]